MSAPHNLPGLLDALGVPQQDPFYARALLAWHHAPPGQERALYLALPLLWRYRSARHIRAWILRYFRAVIPLRHDLLAFERHLSDMFELS